MAPLFLMDCDGGIQIQYGGNLPHEGAINDRPEKRQELRERLRRILFGIELPDEVDKYPRVSPDCRSLTPAEELREVDGCVRPVDERRSSPPIRPATSSAALTATLTATHTDVSEQQRRRRPD